jgi:choline dehydrogenase-like flavoprotein
MIIDGNSLASEAAINVDICIVGGGVAGIVLATELSKESLNIAILESGGEGYTEEAQELYEPAAKPSLYPDPTYSRLRFLGGASNHWANNTSPLDPIDFEKRPWVLNSGWPITYSDIEPYYKSAAQYCGTLQDGYSAEFWADKLGSEDVFKGSKILETGIAKASIPPIRFFDSYGEKLKESKTVKVFINSNLIDLEFNESTQEISKVIFKSNKGNVFQHKIRAKVFILCMGGIENARMMLHFNNKYSHLLGNQGDCVGRYFMDHPTLRAAILYPKTRDRFKLYEGVNLTGRRALGFFKLTEDQQRRGQLNNLRMPLVAQNNYNVSDGISSYHILTDSLSDGEVPENFGEHLVNFFTDIDMVGEAFSRTTFDKKIFDRAEEFGGFQIPIMVEQTPHRDNRIRLSSENDRYGIPKLLIDWEVKQEDKDNVWKTLTIAARGVGASSLGRLRLLREREDRLWEDQLGFSHHHMGTTRMAETYQDGVVDKVQKVFGTSNLYISGSSVFSTGGHVPPTLTIVALTIRLAEHLIAEYKHD